jgi:hypothetical protein
LFSPSSVFASGVRRDGTTRTKEPSRLHATYAHERVQSCGPPHYHRAPLRGTHPWSGRMPTRAPHPGPGRPGLWMPKNPKAFRVREGEWDAQRDSWEVKAAQQQQMREQSIKSFKQAW